jgi:hypothetical protein
MELRRAIGNRKLPNQQGNGGGSWLAYCEPAYRGKLRLWPHACFECCKSWKLSEASNAKCPECGGEIHWMGRAFKAPRKTDDEQWAKVRALWSAGFRFVNHEGWREAAEPYPERLREVEDFILRNPKHPFRLRAYKDG